MNNLKYLVEERIFLMEDQVEYFQKVTEINEKRKYYNKLYDLENRNKIVNIRLIIFLEGRQWLSWWGIKERYV